MTHRNAQRWRSTQNAKLWMIRSAWSESCGKSWSREAVCSKRDGELRNGVKSATIARLLDCREHGPVRLLQYWRTCADQRTHLRCPDARAGTDSAVRAQLADGDCRPLVQGFT